jgi:hypothetical protein
MLPNCASRPTCGNWQFYEVPSGDRRFPTGEGEQVAHAGHHPAEHDKGDAARIARRVNRHAGSLARLFL